MRVAVAVVLDPVHDGWDVIVLTQSVKTGGLPGVDAPDGSIFLIGSSSQNITLICQCSLQLVVVNAGF